MTYSNMDALTVTATGIVDDVINQLHAPSVNHLTIDLSANSGNNQVNVLDVLAEGATPQPQSVTVRTGAGADQVTVFAAQPNHAFNITTGAGSDELTLNALSNVAFQSFTADLGTGDDVARVSGANLIQSAAVNLNGGPDTDTLYYDANGQPIAALDLNGNPLGSPDPNNGQITLQSMPVAKVVYTNFEGVPGFVGPTRDIGGPYVINQGQGVTFHGSATAATNTQILSIAWDLEADGFFGDLYDGSATNGSTASSNPNATWQQLRAFGMGYAGVYPVAMQITTTTGVFNEYTTLTVNKVTPSVTLDGPATVYVGDEHTVSFSSVFVGDERPDSYVVDWGDGSPVDTSVLVNPPSQPADLGRVFGNHYYGLDGNYTVKLSLTKDEQPPITDSFKVTVSNVAPQVDAGPDVDAGIGVPVVVNATFRDPSFAVGGAEEAYTATIEWGDGTSSIGTITLTPGGPGTPATAIVTGTHQYTGNGDYTVTVSVNDGSGIPGRDTFLVTNAVPVVAPMTDITTDQGMPVTLETSFEDLGFDFGGASKSFTTEIDWGDGTSSAGTVTVVVGDENTPTTGTVSASHTYGTFGTFPVVIRVNDEGGAAGEATVTATIGNLPPVADPLPLGGYTPDEMFIPSGSFTDPGLLDAHSVTINWGDGSSSSTPATPTWTTPRTCLSP